MGELGRQRREGVDTVRKKTIYRSTPLVWVYAQGFDTLEEAGELRRNLPIGHKKGGVMDLKDYSRNAVNNDMIIIARDSSNNPKILQFRLVLIARTRAVRKNLVLRLEWDLHTLQKDGKT